MSSITNINKKIQQNNEEIIKLNELKNKIAMDALKNGLNATPKDIKKANKDVANTDKKIIKLQNNIKDLYNKLEDAKAKIIIDPTIVKKGRRPKNNVQKIDDTEIIRVNKVKEDITRFYHKVKYSYNNVKNLKNMFNVINNEMQNMNLEKGFNVSNVILFINNMENKIRNISIPSFYFTNYELFENRVKDIMKGNVHGSDAMDLDNDTLDFNHFIFTYFDEANGFGSNKKIIFECENINNGHCGWDCLKFCGYEHDNKEETINLSSIIDIIKTKDLKIRIIGNTFKIKKFNDLINKPYVKMVYKNNKKNNVSELKAVLYDIQNNYDIITIYEPSNYDFTIIYDELNSHYDILKNNEVKFKNNVLINRNGDVWMDEDLLFTAKQLLINNVNIKPTTKYEYVFFDYETVINFDYNTCMCEYSLSILHLDSITLNELNKADENNDKKTVDLIRETCCITFTGFDCTKQFIKWILDNQCNKVFCFVGFNNSNFDNFILLDGLVKNEHKMGTEYSINQIFYNKNQLLNFKMNGKHHVFDLNKHLTGSLKNNCESFKVNCCSKKILDHHKMQLLYLDGKLIDYINSNNDIKEYNEYDVLATAVLFKKYQNSLSNIVSTSKYAEKLTDNKTIGSLIYNVFSDHIKNKKIELPTIPYNYYKDLMKYKVAGRVELFNGVMEIFEKIASTDVCSLYPFVMCVLNCYYPCGNKITEVDSYQGADTIGFYYCDIDQSNLKNMNLPNIYAEKLQHENKWDTEIILKDYLISNVIIELLKKYNCNVNVKKGFVFQNKIKSCELFEFLLSLMKAKNEQDLLNKQNNPNYIPALRETIKLALNSLSGKVIEGLHTEKTTAIDTLAEYEKIKHNSQNINCVNNVGNKLFITYELDAEKLCETQQRPIYLGVLIYDYAKKYMFEYSYSVVGLNNLLYTDTDATKMKYDDFLNWKKWVDINNIQVPHWEEVEKYDPRYKNHKIFEDNSKVFGSFEDELKNMNGEKYIFYCLEKKSWLYGCCNNDIWNTKFRFKGLNSNALMISLNEPFIKSKIVKHRETKDNKAYDETIYYIDENKNEEVYRFYNDNKNNYIGCDNQIKFFKQIYETGNAYVLNQSFRKIVKNTKQNVDVNDTHKFNNLTNHIKLDISIKHINIRKEIF